MRNVERLSRQIRLLTLLSSNPRGLSSRRLATQLGCGRATVDRDLKLLREQVGVRIEPIRVNGEVWHRLDGVSLRLSVTPIQLAALALARDALAPLAGTAVVRELDALVPAPPGPSTVRFGPAAARPAAVSVIDAAIAEGQRIRVHTRVASRGGELRSYVLEPITLRVVAGVTYLDAWSVERDELRTFKVARIVAAELLPERAAPHPDVELESVFAAAVKTWAGEIARARIRIAADAAWAVSEYPLLPGQTVTAQPDGSVIVEADVAGIVEAARWTLSWGRNAEALDPAELRALVLEELRGAQARYEQTRSRIVSGLDAGSPSAPERAKPRSTARTTRVRGRE